MTKKTNNSMDGVVQRQRRRNIGDFSNTQPLGEAVNGTPTQNKMADFTDNKTPETNKIEESFDMDLDNQLANQDETADKSIKAKWRSKRSKRRLKKQDKAASRSPLNRRLRKVGLFGGIALTVLIGFLMLKGFLALQRIIVDRNGDGSPALNSAAELRGEGDGRINIMLLGVGGEGHPGGELADTIIIASIDPFAKEIAMLSVPRDMYVDVPGYWSMKVNAAHATGLDQDHPGGGPQLMRETLEATLDIPIHYFMRVDFAGYVNAIDTLGGIDINVTNPIYNDYTYAWSTGETFTVDEGWQHLEGERALLYVRSRYTSANGDFDRNERQRDLLVAVKEKVLSVGTFGDPTKIAQLADTAGDHVRTDLQISEILRLYDIVNEIPSENIATYGLTNDDDSFLVGDTIDGGSVQVPKSGDYSDIQRFVREIFVDGFIRSEGAMIELYDGSGLDLLLEQDDELRSYGYQISTTDTLANVNQQTQIYDLKGSDAPFTKRYLEQRFGVTMLSGNELPSSIKVVEDTAFVIVLGANAQ